MWNIYVWVVPAQFTVTWRDNKGRYYTWTLVFICEDSLPVPATHILFNYYMYMFNICLYMSWNKTDWLIERYIICRGRSYLTTAPPGFRSEFAQSDIMCSSKLWGGSTVLGPDDGWPDIDKLWPLGGPDHIFFENRVTGWQNISKSFLYNMCACQCCYSIRCYPFNTWCPHPFT